MSADERLTRLRAGYLPPLVPAACAMCGRTHSAGEYWAVCDEHVDAYVQMLRERYGVAKQEQGNPEQPSLLDVR